jgi:tryptophanase
MKQNYNRDRLDRLEYKNRTLAEILLEMFSYAKGGFIALKDE